MKKHLGRFGLAFFIFLALSFSMGNTYAAETTITFDDVSPSEGIHFLDGEDIQGFKINVDKGEGMILTEHEDDFMVYPKDSNGGLSDAAWLNISKADGSAFKFVSLWIGYYYGNTEVTITGYLDNKIVYGPSPIDTASDSLHTFNWNRVDEVKISAPENLSLLLDDLTYDAAIDNISEVTKNTGLVIDKGESLAISSDHLTTLVAGMTTGSAIYVVENGCENGRLIKKNDSATEIFEFTQQDINDGNILYKHDGTCAKADAFLFAIKDGFLTDQIFNITIDIGDTAAPSIVNNEGISILEGETAVITGSVLKALDIVDDEDIVYTISEFPVNGYFTKNSRFKTVGDSFTQEDINQGWIKYKHDGSKTTEDTFSFKIDDGSYETEVQIFHISVATEDNGSPSIVNNEVVTLDEGGSFSIPSDKLSATTDVIDDSAIAYEITAACENGYIAKVTDLATPIRDFTQADIDGNNIVYIHDDSNTTSDTFAFTLSDGTHTSARAINFEITVNAINDDSPVVKNNIGLAVYKGSSATITGINLKVIDGDNDANALQYTVIESGGHGYLKHSDYPLESPLTQFTQEDINNKKISYVQDNSLAITDAIKLEVTDGVHTLRDLTFEISIRFGDVTSPELTVNTGITISEGASTTIYLTNLAAEDTEKEDDTIVYTLKAIPAHGTFFNPDNIPNSFKIGDTFIQSDLKDNKICYKHDGSNTTDDAFTFTVSDGENEGRDETFNIEITPVDDDAPEILVNTGVETNEWEFVVIRSNNLAATDTESEDASILYNIESVPEVGYLVNGELPEEGFLVNGELPVNISSFTQQDLVDGCIGYMPMWASAGTYNFTFKVSDGTNESSVAQIFTLKVNEITSETPKIASNEGITLNEGESAIIGKDVLSASSTRIVNSAIVYTVTSSPEHGKLINLANSDIAITTFTQDDIDTEKIKYVHDDTDTTEDNFIFKISDGKYDYANQTFNIAITPVDDAMPELVVNNNISTVEGGNVVITEAFLSAEANNPLINLLYNMSTKPSNGHLEMKREEGWGIVLYFTQEDIENKIIRYVHDGSNTISDSIIFEISNSGSILADQSFNITIEPIDDDAPSLSVNKLLTLDEGNEAVISKAVLLSEDEVETSNHVIYTIINNPINGKLVRSSEPNTAVNSFTQQDLNENLIKYIHNGTNTVEDSFKFTVSDGVNILLNQTFSMVIAPFDDDAPTIKSNKVITVDEGWHVGIYSDDLAAVDDMIDDKTIVYTITSDLQHGSLCRTSGNGTKIDEKDILTFTQGEIDNALIKYYHDGSNTTVDSFVFKISDGKNTLEIQEFKMIISPINDDAPTVTLNKGASVKEGEEVIITTDKLTSMDEDIDDALIQYTIMNKCYNGQLEHKDMPGNPITSFTQKDIDDGLIKYMQSGSNINGDEFYFKVSDGEFLSGTRNFKITIIPLERTITFEGNGDQLTMESSIVVPSHTQLSEPTPPEKAGYIFKGWYHDDNTFANRWNFATDTVIEDMILYAKWELDVSEKTVIFEVNGGKLAMSIIVEVKGHTQLLEPTPPKKTGYIFKGWYCDDNTFVNRWNFATDTVIEDMTLYAKWELDDTIIDNTEITGVVAPVRGATPVTTGIDTAQYIGTVTWAPVVDSFAAETIYTATVTLKAKAGYTLAGVGVNSFTVAGATSVVNAVNSGEITIIFPATANLSTSSGRDGGSSAKSTIIKTSTGSVTENQLNIAARVAEYGATVTIKSNNNNEVTFPVSGLGSLVGNTNSLTVVTDDVTLTFDSAAVDSIESQASAEDIKVRLEKVVDKTTLTEGQQSKVGNGAVYNLTVMCGGKTISDFNGGKVTVSIPHELKNGEKAENLKVWYMGVDGSLTEINSIYSVSTKVVTFVVEHFSTYIIGYDNLIDWVNPFTDVRSGLWYYDAIAYVNKNGLMKGQTATEFNGEGVITRGMFATILGRMEDINTSTYAKQKTFSDVTGTQYYAPYIAWASEKSIVSGVDNDKYAPDQAITREQMAVMMTNYMKFKGQGPVGAWAIRLPYGDIDMVSSWANEGIMFMSMKGLMNGMGNDAEGNPILAPNLELTRAQAAQVIMNLGKLVK